ncbi:MAG: sialate O-acetylesterase [Kiritimatiellia bacterium]
MRLRIKLVLVFCAGWLISGGVGIAGETYVGPPGGLQVYLLIGQSNMAGRAPIEEGDKDVMPRCYLLDGEGIWVPAANPLNIHSSIRKGAGMQRLGPGYSFAQQMLAAEPGMSIGLVVNAKGGTKIDQWGKGTAFYDEAVRRAKQAQETGALAGILWHQGESDNANPSGYAEKLTQLIADLRADLGIPTLPFVAGEVRQQLTAINAEIAKLPQLSLHTAVASSEGLTTFDGTHFDNASAKVLGARYAEAILKLQAR